MDELEPQDVERIKALHDKIFAWTLDQVSEGESVSISDLALAAMALQSCADAMKRAALTEGAQSEGGVDG